MKVIERLKKEVKEDNCSKYLTCSSDEAVEGSLKFIDDFWLSPVNWDSDESSVPNHFYIVATSVCFVLFSIPQ